MKKIIITVVLSSIATYFVSPKIIDWWNKPPTIESYFDCPNCGSRNECCEFPIGTCVVAEGTEYKCSECEIKLYLKKMSNLDTDQRNNNAFSRYRVILPSAFNFTK